MTNDYIRRQDAVDALAKTMPTPATPDGAGEFDHEIHIADEAFADAIRIIESIEPTDVAPVRHARWRHYEGMYACEDCGAQLDDESPFCPMCGAKMDGENEAEEDNDK